MANAKDVNYCEFLYIKFINEVRQPTLFSGSKNDPHRYSDSWSASHPLWGWFWAFSRPTSEIMCLWKFSSQIWNVCWLIVEESIPSLFWIKNHITIIGLRSRGQQDDVNAVKTILFNSNPWWVHGLQLHVTKRRIYKEHGHGPSLIHPSQPHSLTSWPEALLILQSRPQYAWLWFTLTLILKLTDLSFNSSTDGFS